MIKVCSFSVSSVVTIELDIFLLFVIRYLLFVIRYSLFVIRLIV